MKFAIVLGVFGALVAIGGFVFLIMSSFSYDPTAIFYIVGSIFVTLNGLIAVGVASVLREVKKSHIAS